VADFLRGLRACDVNSSHSTTPKEKLQTNVSARDKQGKTIKLWELHVARGADVCAVFDDLRGKKKDEKLS